MKKTLSLLLLLSLVLSLASCGQKTTTDDPVAAATLAESYQSYLDTAEPSYAYDIALELTTNPEYFNAEQGGRNAGIPTCFYGTRENADERCDYVIEDLLDLLPILENG